MPGAGGHERRAQRRRARGATTAHPDRPSSGIPTRDRTCPFVGARRVRPFLIARRHRAHVAIRLARCLWARWGVPPAPARLSSHRGLKPDPSRRARTGRHPAHWAHSRAVFDRYNLVNERELLNAGERLATQTLTRPGSICPAVRPSASHLPKSRLRVNELLRLTCSSRPDISRTVSRA